MTRSRASHFVYLLMGAVSVAIVAAVLVATGTFDPRDAAAQATSTPVPPVSPSATPTSVADLYRRVSPGVVYVLSRTPQGQASGSGFVVDADGSIVTNDHVVQDATSVSVRFTEHG